ncbi:unnamed protein product [Closterium sp. Yama58-4]|nr:unnamed protein product [Closterium sp. Yama58-4]
MEDERVSIVVESRNGAARQTAAYGAEPMRDVAGDVAGESHAENDDLTTSPFDETTGGSGAAIDGISADLSTNRRRRRGLWRALINKPTDATGTDDQLERKGLWQGAPSAHISCIPCGSYRKATGGAADHDGDEKGDRGTSWPKLPKSLSGSSGSRSGRGGDGGEDSKDIEAAIRVRTADFDAKSENHYVIVIHGTFDAPPADGAPTWYQPPAPGEQNFCRKLSRLFALGPIGEDAIWRDLPCSALPGIPYPFHWDGTNTHLGRVTAAMKLHNLIDQIAQNDPAARIHLVAHSHGGNVMLKTIELYMAKLGRRSKNEWHPVVARQFWAAHRRSYELIKRWRRIDMRGSWWRFFPFLVVFRGFNGQRTTGVKESYPWAYQQWLDSLLRLPAVRQRRFLAFRHATSPITNALGALVFLGTPFYIKKWQTNGFLWLLVSTVLNVVLLYVFILVYTSIWQIIVLLIAGRPQDFYGQSAPPFIIATGIMLLINVKQVMDVLRTTVFYSGNLYHKPSFDWSPAMSALVIHAGKLDEASLALSMEPITRAYVFPHLTKLLKQTPWAPFPKPPTRYARQVDWWAFFFHCAIILVWDTLFFLPAAIMSVCSHIIAPIVTGTLQKMIVTVSFGLSPGDLNYAYIYVDEHLDLDLATQQVDHWNVQKLLAEAKTKSLKGELMPGYEDDTVEQPEWLEPVLHSPHQPSHLRSPRAATPTGAAASAAAASAGSPVDSLTSPRGMQQTQGAFGRPRSRKGVRGGRLTTLAAVAEAAIEANERGVSFWSPEREPQVGAAVGVHEREGVGAAAGGYQREQRGDTGTGEFEQARAGVAVMAEQSQTFQRLKSQMNKIGRNPRLSEREFERQLQQLCVMIEERMGELTGRFDLNHGAYFRDPRILRVIAHFIETRELPEWSKGIDGDIWRWNENLAKIQSKQLQQMAMGGGGGGSGNSEGLGGSGGKVGESSSREKELIGGSSGAAKLKSLIKSMRGGSGREGGFKGSSTPSFDNIDFNAADGSGSVGSEGGSVRGMSSFSGLESVRGKAVSFGVSGAPRPKLELPNLKPAAIAAPLKKIRSTVAGVASTVSSTVNVTRHQGDAALAGRIQHPQ